MSWYCYILKNTYTPHQNRTYNGATNNPKRRIRQHNGEIKGGAKYTNAIGNKSWEFYAIIKGFPDQKNCLQMEWRIKHPDNKRRRRTKYCGKRGRILGLNEVLKLDQWTNNSVYKNKDLKFELWIVKEYADLLIDVPNNIEVNIVDKIDLDNIV